jgi:NTP pyrophosphatase (non-canonical NTP hydrolase)
MALTFEDYQLTSQRTDQVPLVASHSPELRERALMVPLLGLAGESGSLLTEYKKWLREGDAYILFKDQIAEELGDVLWYVTNLASKAGLRLEDVAERNLKKTRDRWHTTTDDGLFGHRLLDEPFPEAEQLPREFRVELHEFTESGRVRVAVTFNGQPYGDPLTDNAYEEDGYRFHDVFHFAFAAILGWSPITRRTLKRKRKSQPSVDEVDDGARAAVIEEAVSALVFNHAATHSFFDGVDRVEYDLLATVKALTAQLEVGRIALNEWERAILEGYRVWRAVSASHGGVVVGDLGQRTLRYEPASRGDRGSV